MLGPRQSWFGKAVEGDWMGLLMVLILVSVFLGVVYIVWKLFRDDWKGEK